MDSGEVANVDVVAAAVGVAAAVDVAAAVGAGVAVADAAAESNWHTFGQGLELVAYPYFEQHSEKEGPLLRCFLRSASIASASFYLGHMGKTTHF